MRTEHTSKLWWLGFGMTLKFDTEQVTIKKSFRSVTINYNDINGVHIERRAFRGNTLVINTVNKPVYFRMMKRQATTAMHFINAKVTDYKAYLKG